MSRSLSIHPEAREELAKVALWYEDQCPGLGRDFIESYEQAVREVLEFPLSGGFERGEVRRCQLRRFPYKVIYHVFADKLLVLAVSHFRQRPDYWMDRMGTT